MKQATKQALLLIIAYYLVAGLLFGWFAYANWTRVDRAWWFDLGAATVAVFGFLIPPLGRDLKEA